MKRFTYSEVVEYVKNNSNKILLFYLTTLQI